MSEAINYPKHYGGKDDLMTKINDIKRMGND